jgi:hypothetical protein
MPTNWTRRTPSPLLPSMKHYFKALSFHTSQLSPSGEWVTLKTLFFDSQSSVKCSNQSLIRKNTRSVFPVTVTVGNLGVKLNATSCMYVCTYVRVYWLRLYLIHDHYYYYYYYYYYYTSFCFFFQVAHLLWMVLLFKLFVISESCPRFPALVPTLRLLNLFLLQTWWAKMSTSLWNAWFH